MESAPAIIEHATNTTTSVLSIVKSFSKSAAVVADSITPFVPLMSEISNIVNEIIQLYQTAEHNKRICGSLLSRATSAETAVKNLKIRRLEKEDMFKSKEYYKNFQKLVAVISKIKTFIAEVSQIKGLRKFLVARSIEGEFQELTSEFDGLMRVMNFTMAVQNQIQMEEDQKILRHDISEMTKYLKEIEGGIANSMLEINSTLEDIAQLNHAWQNKLLNEDQNVLESATINIEELHDPPVTIRRGEHVFKKIRRGEEVAIKEKILREDEKRYMNDIISQVVILKKLKESTYILKFYGIAQDANALYMVTEWCELGNLQEYYRANPMDWSQKSQLAVDIARGLTFLHAVSILHHDIRSENILITEHGQAKIANFNLSRGANDPTKDVRPTIDTVRWMAPEKLKDNKNKYNTKCEIYSFGMLLWEIAEGQTPFADEIDLLVIRDIVVKQKKRPVFSKNVPPEWSKISYQAMQDSPNARPALKDIFMILYSLHQKNLSQRSPRPSPNHIPSEDELPGIDDDLGIDLTMSVKEAISEHKKKDGDKNKVWEAFKIHAEEFGDMTASYWMGYYLYYDLCPIDNPDDKEAKQIRLEKAASLFKKAADMGIVDAQLRYGHCLWYGEGVQRSIKDAIEYFQKSADNGNGNTTAIYNIGNIYYNGLGVEQDMEKGIRFLRLAALQGQPKALEMCKKKGISLADIGDN